MTPQPSLSPVHPHLWEGSNQGEIPGRSQQALPSPVQRDVLFPPAADLGLRHTVQMLQVSPPLIIQGF